jgi:hypothetical protein
MHAKDGIVFSSRAKLIHLWKGSVHTFSNSLDRLQPSTTLKQMFIYMKSLGMFQLLASCNEFPGTPMEAAHDRYIMPNVYRGYNNDREHVCLRQ